MVCEDVLCWSVFHPGTVWTDWTVSCIDVNSDDTLLACGIADRLAFWDLRTMSHSDTFNDSHSDEVTQVRFHPRQPKQLLTASEDGLVCLFDLALGGEEDALVNGPPRRCMQRVAKVDTSAEGERRIRSSFPSFAYALPTTSPALPCNTASMGG